MEHAKQIPELICGSGYGSKFRKIILRVGEQYKIEPFNTLKENRDRTCVVTKIINNYPDYTVWVKYLDNNRAGRPDIRCLVPINEALILD